MLDGNTRLRSPFGIKTERFAATGYHPGLECRPVTVGYPKLFSGCYNWNKPQRVVSAVPSWKRQEKTAEYSRSLGYRGDLILRKKEWLRSINGPGWQDVPRSLSKKSVTFPKAKRFPVGKFKDFAVPGPGTYGKNHIPYSILEEKSHARGFSFSTLAPFDRASCAPRSISAHRSYYLPPNLYNIKTSIDELISKRVSKRGPYDLFTGERFPDLILTKQSMLTLWLNPSDWNHPKNAFKGKFKRCGKDSQMCSRLVLTDLALAPKNPLDPGPSDYNPYPQPVVASAHAPFNSSVAEARPVVKCSLSPPPGRYYVESKRKIKGNGMKSSFISKTKRGIPLPEKLSWFE